MTKIQSEAKTGFEVEWISSLGKQDDPRDFNPDRCIYSFRNFRTIEAAKSFAATVESPQVNAAWIQEFKIEEEFEGLHKVYLGDRIEVECIFKP